VVHLLPATGEEEQVSGEEVVFHLGKLGVLLSACAGELHPQVAVDIDHKPRAVETAVAIPPKRVGVSHQPLGHGVQPVGVYLGFGPKRQKGKKEKKDD